MTKPWEETWERQHLVVGVAGGGPSVFGSGIGVPYTKEEGDRERAVLDLGACAPELARMLLKLRNEGGTHCAVCDMVEHTEDCEWAALMRKAGVDLDGFEAELQARWADG